MRIQINKNNFFRWLRQSYIFIVLAIIYIPMIFLVFLSFTGENERGNITNNFTNVSFDGYINIIHNSEFWNALLNSTIIAMIVVPISLFISVMTCIGIWNSKNSVEKYIMGFAKSNIAIPDIICGISLLMLFSTVFLSIGLSFGFFTIVLAHISFCVPYAIVSIYPNLTKIKKNLIYASLDLGYSKGYTYFKVIIPILKMPIISATILMTIMSFDDFVITTLVKGNVETIGSAIYNSRKGIKAWIVTFGAIIVLAIIFSTTVITILKWKKERKNNSKKVTLKENIPISDK